MLSNQCWVFEDVQTCLYHVHTYMQIPVYVHEMNRNYIFVQTRMYNYIFVCTWYKHVHTMYLQVLHSCTRTNMSVHGSDMSVPFCQILSRWSGFQMEERPWRSRSSERSTVTGNFGVRRLKFQLKLELTSQWLPFKFNSKFKFKSQVCHHWCHFQV